MTNTIKNHQNTRTQCSSKALENPKLNSNVNLSNNCQVNSMFFVNQAGI